MSATLLLVSVLSLVYATENTSLINPEGAMWTLHPHYEIGMLAPLPIVFSWVRTALILISLRMGDKTIFFNINGLKCGSKKMVSIISDFYCNRVT